MNGTISPFGRTLSEIFLIRSQKWRIITDQFGGSVVRILRMEANSRKNKFQTYLPNFFGLRGDTSESTFSSFNFPQSLFLEPSRPQGLLLIRDKFWIGYIVYDLYSRGACNLAKNLAMLAALYPPWSPTPILAYIVCIYPALLYTARPGRFFKQIYIE